MLKLIQTDWQRFDLALDAGDDDNAAVATLVYALLFTDQEAPDSRVNDPFDRRGWYKNPNAGSGLWHVRRQPLTPAARQEAIHHIQRALSQAPALSDIVVEETSQGNVSGVAVSISGKHNGRQFVLKVPLSSEH